MYELVTFDVILRRMTGRILAQDPNLDTREGSVIYNALAPAAVELQNMHIQLDTILSETFADTATGGYLVKRASERGIAPYPATSAILQGEFNMDIPTGARFSLQNEDLNYIATEKISAGRYKMQCETAGATGNNSFGTLIPIDYISGLTSAQLTQLLIPGEDEESTEHLRRRYYDSLNATAFGGNVQDYKEKVDAITGVGGVKVYPVWNGGGTVRIVIISSDYSVPSQAMIDNVQSVVDPPPHGEGYGIAPIGHIVTVAGVTEETINISATMTYQDGWGWDDVRPYAEQAVDAYFSELAASWDSADAITVRISQIEARFLALPGIVDITAATLNGQPQNLTLGGDEIPERGSING